MPGSPAGKQEISSIKGKKYPRVSVIAAQYGKDILALLIFEGAADTNLLDHWLEKCLKPGKTIVLGNYVIHKSERA